MKPVHILILSDAGAAGRILLARRDVELGWALTVDEAVRALERRRPRVVLTREEFAMPFQKAAAELLERVPVVVLLESDGWSRRPEHFAAGATALVSASSEPRIMEAITELTGLPTRHAPRVPYPEVVDVCFLGSKLYLEAVELGASGIAIRDFPPARTGERVEVGLVMMDPPIVLSGMVVRSHIGRSGAVTEVAFNALDEHERARLEGFVVRYTEQSSDLPEPVGLTGDIFGGTFTLDLFEAFGSDATTSGPWLKLLAERVRNPTTVRAPKWLTRVERDLSDVERRVLRSAPAPAFAQAALELRVDLARVQSTPMLEASSLRESSALALDFCRALATDAQDARPEWKAQVPEIRAGILTQVYGWTFSSENRADQAA